MNKLKIYNNRIFEDIKHIDENGNEYWSARELMPLLEYNKWENFNKIIKQSITSCKNSNNIVSDHFPEVRKMINIAKGAKRKVIDYKLSRYACYLIAQNGDSRKNAISLAQTYFAIQTRRQEVFDKDYNLMTEDEKRVYNREITRSENLSLNHTALKAGVTPDKFGEFHNAGYKGLYNGETADDIAKRKRLRYREEILDNMCSEELAANIFRISQTESKLIRDKIKGNESAIETHYNVGSAVRNTIKDLGGTMPEDLPTPNKSIEELKKEQKQIKRKNNKKIGSKGE